MSREIFGDYISPALDKVDSERVHVAARELLHFAESSPAGLKVLERFAYRGERFSDARLRVSIGGVELENPVLVGAGWDKPGRAVKALYTLGFSGVEVGSVLAYPQPGNPKPRQFMIGPGVALNRLGFNSPGMDVVARNLGSYKDSGIPIGISVGKNKDVPNTEAPEAHAVVVDKLYEYGAYFVINVSSPNTPGLRQLQDRDQLTDIVVAVNQTMDDLGGRKPLFVKIAPELTNEAVDDVIRVVIENGLTGIVATNTTNSEGIKSRYGRGEEAGGVSGSDGEFRNMAIEKIAHIFSQVGNAIEIIGVGGINDPDSAMEKIKAGADAIQVVTAIREVGPTLPGRINRGLVQLMERDGIVSLDEVRGSGSCSS